MKLEVDFARKTLVDQVTENLRESIKDGKFSNHSAFPSSRELASLYGTSHNIMLKVLHQLQDEGFIYLDNRRRGYKLQV